MPTTGSWLRIHMRLQRKQNPQKAEINSAQRPAKNGLGVFVAGGVGFEPTTTDLGGRCSVRSEGFTTHDHPPTNPCWATRPIHPTTTKYSKPSLTPRRERKSTKHRNNLRKEPQSTSTTNRPERHQNRRTNNSPIQKEERQTHNKQLQKQTLRLLRYILQIL